MLQRPSVEQLTATALSAGHHLVTTHPVAMRSLTSTLLPNKPCGDISNVRELLWPSIPRMERCVVLVTAIPKRSLSSIPSMERVVPPPA